MKFKDKLPKLRKEQNLSQEQLADRLGVSRQAVSKWESGQSYPDMNKMIEIASTLNTTLDKLLDDGALGEEIKEEKQIKPKDLLHNTLKFITSSVNMFFSMSFKEKIVCIFEMGALSLTLAILSYIIYAIIVVFSDHFFFFIPHPIKYYVTSVIGDLTFLALVIIIIITIIHIFKVRYLNYYITIEDPEVSPSKRQKVIIRDPKHSTTSFIKILSKLLKLFLKGVLLFVFIPLIIMFVFILMLVAFTLYHINIGIISLYVLLTLLGISISIYLLIKIIYNFIFNLKTNFNKIFHFFIISLVLIGIFSGLTLTTYLNYKPVKVDYNNKDFITDNREINFADNIILPFLREGTTEINIDNNEPNIKLEISHLKEATYNIYTYNDTYYDKNYLTYGINCYPNTSGISNLNDILDDIKNKQRRDYLLSNTYKVTITTSLDNLNKLKENLTIIY